MQEKSTFEGISELWSQLNRNQRRFVVAMQEFPTKKEAAESIGLEPDTVYRWPDVVDRAVDAFSSDVEAAVMGVLRSIAGKAAMIKASGLDSEDEKIRQAVASEIIDRILGKATQRQEVTGADGEPVPIQFISIERSDDSDN